jgi:hypothetical protein
MIRLTYIIAIVLESIVNSRGAETAQQGDIQNAVN